MIEPIKQKQLRLIKRGFYNDEIFTRDDCCGYLKAPIMGKTLKDIVFRKCKHHEILVGEKVITKGKTFEAFSIYFNHSSSTMYVITVDSKIYYYTFSSIFAPASSAFHTLTEVYFIGHTKDMNWQWGGKRPAQCWYHLWSGDGPEPKPIAFKNIKDDSKFIDNLYYHY